MHDAAAAAGPEHGAGGECGRVDGGDGGGAAPVAPKFHLRHRPDAQQSQSQHLLQPGDEDLAFLNSCLLTWSRDRVR